MAATVKTMMDQMVNPEVMADMISANLPRALKYTQILTIDDRLQGTAGNTVKVPAFKYMGDAADVGEGQPIDLKKLETSVTEFTIKKAGNGFSISDEAVLSGYGDPVGEAVRQLGMSIAAKIETDVIEALKTTNLAIEDTNPISYEGIVNGVDKFIEESDIPKVLFIHPEQLSQIRKSEDFIDKNKYGGDLMMTGAIGSICGVEVIVSRGVPKEGGKFTNFMVQMAANAGEGSPSLPAVTIFMKRGVQVESDRDIISKFTVVTADQHYGVALTNPARVLKMTFKA